MDTNAVTSAEDTEMSDYDGEKVVTMMDVLQEQEDIENDANAVLGASDEKNCTYSKGYIKRQAIYACMTCCAEAKDDPSKRAGVCLACSLTCHENHELIELYTKRNFRCDCGNPKFNSNPCQYTPNKTDLNEDNEYNQNFSGLYCVCNRPYPDPENSIDDVMIQCIICEDWLHGLHLEAKLPPNDQYSEMICKSCMEKNLFLHDYSNLAVNVENEVVDVVFDNTENKNFNDLNNDQVLTSKDTSTVDIIQENTDKSESEENKLEEGENIANIDDSAQENTETFISNKSENTLHKPESNDTNTTAKDTNDDNVISSDSKGDKQAGQESDSKISRTTPNVDAESMEEDRLLADPEEDGIEEPLNHPESVSKGNQISEDTENVKSDTILNKADEVREDTKADIDTEKKEFEREKDETKGDSITNTNSETLKDKKDNELDGSSVDKENTDMEQNDNNEDENQSSEQNKENEQLPEKAIDQDNVIDSNQDKDSATLNNDTEVVEDKILDASKTDHETTNEEVNVAHDTKDSSSANKEMNDEKEENTDVEMKNEKDLETKTISENDNELDDKTSENKRKHPTEESENIVADSGVGEKRVKLDSKCIRPKNIKRVYKGATFWPSDFRQKLCTCNECLTMYKDLSVLFLTDLEDTVRAYENLGEERERIEGKPVSQYEKGLQALSSLDRIQQINALTEYNKMKDKLLDFLKNFKDRKEVVKEEDIKQFFAGMKPKREPDGVYFCR